MTTEPYRHADAAVLLEVRALLDGARHGVLAVLDEEGWPMAARIGLQTDSDGTPLALLSGLSMHTRRLRADPRAALLIGGARAKGSPLAQPRLSLQVSAALVCDEAADLRERWQSRDPRAAVYVGLADFRFWRLPVRSGLFNGGFGRAVRLTAADLAPDAKTPAS